MFINYKPVKIGSTCNFNCRICDCEREPAGDLTTEELICQLNTIPKHENIVFTGGEFFIRKDMLTIIKFASERFSSVKYSTNGAMFAYREVVERSTANGLNIIYLNFFSIDPEIHSIITRTDTHQYVVQGFENLVDFQNNAYIPFVERWECGFFLAVNLFVNSLTLPNLLDTSRYISKKSIPRLIINFSCSDCASDEAILAARRCVEEAAANGTWAIIKGLPVCAMRGFEEHCGDVFRIDRFVPGNVFIPGVCKNCVLSSTCGGVASSIADKRQWTPITSESRIDNLDDIVFFHEHIPTQIPAIFLGDTR